MEMNKTGQNREKKADHQIIKKDEQRCVDDSNCCRRYHHVPQKASTCSRLTPRGIGHLPAGSSHHRGGVTICDTGNFFHSPQHSREVLFIMVCQLL